MTYAKLLGLNQYISDVELIRLLAQKNEIQIEDTVIMKPVINHDNITGDFGDIIR